MSGVHRQKGFIRGVGFTPSGKDRDNKTSAGVLVEKRDAAKAEQARIDALKEAQLKLQAEAEAQADRHRLIGKERSVFIATYIQESRRCQKEQAHSEALLEAYQVSKAA